VGYTGGTTPSPTYRNLGDHTETIQIDYDPDQISYEKLLALFWKGHDPTERSWSKQYMAVLFFHNDNQKRLAVITRDRLAAQKGQKIYTQIFPASEFTLAETYHQKHALRGHRRLMEVFNTLYGDKKDFVNSIAAARTNGFAGGYGTVASLERELTRLALSPEATSRILEILRSYDR
jgi:peptide-methionine (S)-S-oxide reductase